jgi:hypothetical protein
LTGAVSFISVMAMPPMSARVKSVDFQAGGSNVSFEFRDTFGVTAQQRFNNRYGLVSASQPDLLWAGDRNERPSPRNQNPARRA